MTSRLSKPASAPPEYQPETVPIVRRTVQVFLLCTGLYLLTWAGHYTTGDGSYKVAWAKSMFLRHSAVIDVGNGPTYCKYGIGHSLIAIPPLALAHFIWRTTGIRCEAPLYTLIFIVNGALFLALLYFYLAKLYPSGLAIWAVFIIGFATIWWPYTKLDFSEPLVLTIAFLGFVLLRFGHPMPGLTIVAATLAVRMDSAVVMVPMIAWYLHRDRSLRAVVRVALSVAPWVTLVLVANYVRFHSLSDRSYADEHFSNPLLVGLFGVLFSAGKSIFLFSPPLLLGAIGWNHFRQRSETRSDAWLFLAICVAQVLLYAKWWDWSSDDAWGNRFLVPGVLLMCIPMVEVLQRRMLVYGVAAAGLFVQLLAVSVGGLQYVLLLRSHAAQRQALYVDGRNRVDFEDMRYSPNYSQLAGHWILLRHLLGYPPEPESSQEGARIGTRLYDTLSPQDWDAAAKWDLIWNVHRSPR